MILSVKENVWPVKKIPSQVTGQDIFVARMRVS
jgi:hypothetical protein